MGIYAAGWIFHRLRLQIYPSSKSSIYDSKVSYEKCELNFY